MSLILTITAKTPSETDELRSTNHLARRLLRVRRGVSEQIGNYAVMEGLDG
jgi:hypothetical protein